MLLILTLIACSYGPAIVTLEAPVELEMGACLSPAAGWTDDLATPTLLDATLIDLSDDEPLETACGSDDWQGWIGQPNRTQWLTLEEADGTVWHAALALPQSQLEDLLGEEVSIDFDLMLGDWSPDSGHFVLSHQGAWRSWVSRSGMPDDLTLPSDVSVRQGDEAFLMPDECGDWSYYDSDVTIGAESQVIGVGQTMAIGDADVTIGTHKLERQANTGTCMDWFVADVILGATR